ncbi:MAG: pentapeptide repeat-containing protein [Deltaproteobacteria bacterium]|nr:pentapeptide repeat-containing protein [Deltaproteobacteria bacterium]
MDVYKPVAKFFHKGAPLQDILRNHEKWIREREGRKADLIGAELSRIDLSGAYLRGADLLKANLRDCTLEKANLSGANGYAAHLSRANLRGANLRGANLEKANLMDSVLEGADLSDANLKGAQMAAADLRKVLAERACMQGAYLRGADLREADFYKSDLRGTVLIGAKMDLAKFKRANLSGANVNEVGLCDATLPYADLREADFAGAKVERALLRSANLRDSDFSHASLMGSDLSGADLSGIRLFQTDLSGCVLADILCTHVLEGEAGEMIRLSPGEFESRYTKNKKISEMIVEIPLSGSAYYIAGFITRSVNSLMGSQVVDFRGAESLSETRTRFIFNLQDHHFLRKQRDAFEGAFPHALNGYFAENRIGSQPSYMGGILEGAIGEETTFPDLQEAQPDGLMENYSRLKKIGEDIYGIAHSVFRGTR